jgi:ABC-type multidrug transport system fused ATPase/permease subunit
VLNKTRGKFEKVRPIVRKVLEVLDDNEKFYIPEGPRMFHGLKKSIEFRNATFSYYPDVPVLKEVSFSIEKGKMTAIVGPTGAGKTTIMNLIMRFYDCAPARVFVDGTDIREYTLKSLRDHMALVDQDVIVFNDTIMNNIAFGIDERVSDEKLNSVVKKAQLDDLIGRLPDGFRTEVGDRGIKLSGGEKQRISIGRALLKDSDIVLLDEATSSLDTGTEKRIQKAIEEAIRGRTTVVIAHRLSTIKNADKIIVIEEGRLIEQGTLEELLAKKGRFYQYWEEQKFY